MTDEDRRQALSPAADDGEITDPELPPLGDFTLEDGPSEEKLSEPETRIKQEPMAPESPAPVQNLFSEIADAEVTDSDVPVAIQPEEPDAEEEDEEPGAEEAGAELPALEAVDEEPRSGSEYRPPESPPETVSRPPRVRSGVLRDLQSGAAKHGAVGKRRRKRKKRSRSRTRSPARSRSPDPSSEVEIDEDEDGPPPTPG